jgi:hypothetical protein
MSYSGPNTPSIVIQNCGSPQETVTVFHSAEEAKALFATLNAGIGGDPAHYLFLEPTASKELKPAKWSGTYTDAYGAVRVVGTNVLD